MYDALRNRDDYASGNTVFHHWLYGAANYEEWRRTHPMWAGGYKPHISVDPPAGERAAELILPFLRNLNVHHKIVSGPTEYADLNRGRQRGKFITIYSGPSLNRFTELVGALDGFLMQANISPGPRPIVRAGADQGQAESAIGRSGLITYITTPDYED
jgi:hypothetical protein